MKLSSEPVCPSVASSRSVCYDLIDFLGGGTEELRNQGFLGFKFKIGSELRTFKLAITLIFKAHQEQMEPTIVILDCLGT